MNGVNAIKKPRNNIMNDLRFLITVTIIMYMIDDRDIDDWSLV